MTKEQAFFINCIRDHAHGEKTQYDETLNLEELRKIAKKHALTGIFAFQLHSSEGTLSPELSREYAYTVFHSSMIRQQYDLVTGTLSENGIEVIPVKGMEIAQYYPVPALRSMGDIDLLINKSDREKINSLMDGLGYKCIKNAEERDWGYLKSGVEFELHPTLIYSDEEVEKKEFISFFNNYREYTENGKLKNEFHYLFLFAHLRKHLLNHGAGFRQFMDIAFMTEKLRDSMDWKWIEKKLSELGIKKFSYAVYSCNSSWFDIAPPYDIKPLDEETVTAITEKIFDNGVFGFQASDDKAALISYQISKRGKHLARLRNFFRRIFPSYSVMRHIKKYEFVNNRPWLMPLAWVYRFCISVGKLKEKKVFSSSASDEQIESRLRFIEKIGLD